MRISKVVKITGVFCFLVALFWIGQPALRFMLQSPETIDSYFSQGQELKGPLINYFEQSGSWPEEYKTTGKMLPWTVMGRWKYYQSPECGAELNVGGMGFYVGWCASRDHKRQTGECGANCLAHGWEFAD